MYLKFSRYAPQQVEKRNGWINVGDLQGAVHFRIVKYERIKFLVIALKDSIEIYAWAPKPYHKFMAFKVRTYLYALLILFTLSDRIVVLNKSLLSSYADTVVQ